MSRKHNMTDSEIAEHALSIAIGTIRSIMMDYQNRPCPRGLPMKLLKEAIEKEIRHYEHDEV